MNSFRTPLYISALALAPAGKGKGGAAPAAPEAGEITKDMPNANLPATAPVFEGNGRPVVLNGRQFIAKQLTRNVIPQRPGETVFVKITGPIYQGEKIAKATGEAAKMAPAKLMPVIDLRTGELGLLIANAVLESSLDEKFPKQGYVDKEFGVTMKDVPGKRYKQFVVYELEPAPAA